MKTIKAFYLFLRSTKIEWLLTIAGLGAFLVLVPILISWMYGGSTDEVAMVKSGYIVDFFWRVVRVPALLLIVWGIFKWFFTTLERHVDPDDKPTLDEDGNPITFEKDWLKMSPTARNTLTIATLLVIILSISLIIVFP